MAEFWPVNLTMADKSDVTLLRERYRLLGMPTEYTKAIRAAVKLALSASDADLKRGEL